MFCVPAVFPEQGAPSFLKVHNLFLNVFPGDIKCLCQAVQAVEHVAAPVYQFPGGPNLITGQNCPAFSAIISFIHRFRHSGALPCQAAEEQPAVMSGNGGYVVVFLHPQVLPGKNIPHGKSVPGGVGDSRVGEDAADFPLLIKEIVAGDDKLIVRQMLDEGVQV